MKEKDFVCAYCVMQEAFKRAKLVLGYFSGNEESAQISLLDDGRVLVSTWDAVSDYDSYILEREDQYFPAGLLFCTDEEVQAWKAEEKRVCEQRKRARDAQRDQQVEAALRAQYEELKKRFGGK